MFETVSVLKVVPYLLYTERVSNQSVGYFQGEFKPKYDCELIHKLKHKQLKLLVNFLCLCKILSCIKFSNLF